MLIGRWEVGGGGGTSASMAAIGGKVAGGVGGRSGGNVTGRDGVGGRSYLVGQLVFGGGAGRDLEGPMGSLDDLSGGRRGGRGQLRFYGRPIGGCGTRRMENGGLGRVGRWLKVPPKWAGKRRSSGWV